MSRRSRAEFAIIAIMMLMLAVIYLTANSTILNSFAVLEVQNSEQDMSRLRAALAKECAQIDSNVADWAAWDDAYAFMANGNEDFIKSSLPDATFANLGINLVLFVDPSGKVVFGRALDLEAKRVMPISSALRDHLSADKPLVQHADGASGVSGVLLLPEGPMLVASHPIISSDRASPIRGALIFGRYLDDPLLEHLTKQIALPFTALRFDQAGLPTDAQAVWPALLQGDATATRILAPHSIAAYGMVRDIYGQPALLLRIEVLRVIYQRGQTSVRYFFIWLVAITAGFALSVHLLVRKLLRSEHRQRESETRYRGVFDHVPAGLYRTTPQGQVFDANPALVKMLGYPHRESLLAAQLDRGYADPEGTRQWAELVQHQEVTHSEAQWRRYDGTPIWVQETARIIRNEEGQVTCYEGMVEDISERKHTEEALRKAYAQNQQLLASISSLLIGVSADGLITHWNTPTEMTLGIAAANVLDRPFAQCGILWDWPAIDRGLAACRQENRPIHLRNIRYTRPNGKDGFLDITLNPFIGEDSWQTGILVLAEEITQHKVMEMQLAQAQKLQAIGQLAAGIAHEINTPMQYVDDNTTFLQNSFAALLKVIARYRALPEPIGGGPRHHDSLSEAEAAAEQAEVDYLLIEIPTAIQQSMEGVARVTEIVQAMREFSHPGTAHKVGLDINKAIRNTLAVAHNEWKYVAEVQTDLDSHLPHVPCLPSQFNEAILNILVNAAHAIGDVVKRDHGGKGIISISTRRDGEWAEIRIRDTGTGIPEAIRSRIFDPFFTTKEVGKGTGQGLSIAHHVVVEKHGGTITFETEVGQGTTFIVRLPLATEDEADITEAA